MADKVTFTIDGRSVEAPAGTTILEAAKGANILIPNLCHNEELAPYGACRMCMVETTHKKRTKLVVSCIAEASEGLEVKTDTERVRNVRTLVMHLLLARNPRHPVLLDMAARLGIEKSRFAVDFKGCILCGQCVRVCREVVGVSAIGFESRGPARKIATPFNEAPADCIACGSCHYVCPVGVIAMDEHDGVRTMWKTEFPMAKCTKCGKHFAPVKQLEYFRKIANLPADHFDTCIDCRSTKK
jgi:NADH dehydrogenase/NADH:ubiquinone oxidoreductase subunit G